MVNLHIWSSYRERISLLLALAVLPLFSGCVSYSQASWKQSSLDYKPVQVDAGIPATAVADVSFNATEGVKATMKSVELQTDQSIANYEKAVADVLFEDLANSGLFTRVSHEDPGADLRIRIQGEQATGGRLKVFLAVLNPKTNESVLTYTREKTDATATLRVTVSGEALGEVMGQIKTAIAADFKSKDLSKLGGKFAVGATVLASSTERQTSDTVQFEDLLVAKESYVMLARQRNRSLVAAKTLTLPKLLRESKTAELTSLTVRIEQVILDLNHEAEMEKDRAQRALEQSPQTAENHRELSIVYKDRIEVLKPINAAIKEEIANRER